MRYADQLKHHPFTSVWQAVMTLFLNLLLARSSHYQQVYDEVLKAPHQQA